jgi:hypothetical protein
MGFSLAGFGAGLAEGVYERIEEERKFSNAALQGRLERASVLKMQQEKEAAALEKELRERKSELIGYGVEDPELMKAYLFSPVAFEALKKARMSTEDNIRNLSPKDIITPNATKIAQMTGTVDELISNAVRSRTQVEPAKLLDTQGRSWLSPSAGQMQRRLEQTAAARGMTLEDVARAESGFRPSMPEPTATVNFGVFKKEDKSTNEQRQSILDRQATEAIVKFGEESKEAKEAKAAADSWRKAADTVEPKTPEDVDKQIKRLQGVAVAAVQQFGEGSPQANEAARKYRDAVVIVENLTKPQIDHAKSMAKYQQIVRAPQNYTDAQVKEARQYLDNDAAEKKRYKDNNEPNPLEPQKQLAYSNVFRRSAASAVERTFGRKKGWTLVDVKDPDTNQIIGKEAKYNGQLPPDVVNENILYVEQKGIIDSAKLSGYIDKDNTVRNPLARGALDNFGFKFNGNKVIEPTKPSKDLTVEARPTTVAVPPAPAASSRPARPMTPTEVADDFANIGAPAGGAAAPRTQQRPAKPASVPGAPTGHSVGDYVEGKGYAVYNKQGKLIGYATE